MKRPIHTLYLLPHTHTDIGYSHNPVVTLDFHKRFLDRAIGLCEQTRDYPDGARFRWTVEVFFGVLRWWESRGEIDIGARYLNGAELYAPEDVAWEATELARLVALTGYSPGHARMRFRLQWLAQRFYETTARHLDETFDRDYLTHPET
jgi:hypothetical protein